MSFFETESATKPAVEPSVAEEIDPALTDFMSRRSLFTQSNTIIQFKNYNTITSEVEHTSKSVYRQSTEVVRREHDNH